jgi:hypothetical protein
MPSRKKKTRHPRGNQKAPQVASDGRGNFIVVWQSQGQDGDGFGIMGRR